MCLAPMYIGFPHCGFSKTIVTEVNKKEQKNLSVRQKQKKMFKCPLLGRGERVTTERYVQIYIENNGKAIPLQARCGPEGG